MVGSSRELDESCARPHEDYTVIWAIKVTWSHVNTRFLSYRPLFKLLSVRIHKLPVWCCRCYYLFQLMWCFSQCLNMYWKKIQESQINNSAGASWREAEDVYRRCAAVSYVHHAQPARQVSSTFIVNRGRLTLHLFVQQAELLFKCTLRNILETSMIKCDVEQNYASSIILLLV